MKAGDIVLIRFPQADLTAGKLRPALALAVAPGRHEDVLLALITSRLYQAVSDFDEIITERDEDFPESGLKVASAVRLARLVTIETSLINARLGRISAERLRKLRSRLAAWLQE